MLCDFFGDGPYRALPGNGEALSRAPPGLLVPKFFCPSVFPLPPLSPVPRRPIRFPFLPSFLSSPPFHLLQLSPSPISLSPWEHRSGVSIREAISPVYHPRALLRFSTRSPELSTLRALLRVIHGAPRLSPSPWNFCSGVPICEAIPLDYSSVRFAPEHIPLCVPHFTRCSTVSALRAATILCLLHVWPPAGQAPPFGAIN